MRRRTTAFVFPSTLWLALACLSTSCGSPSEGEPTAASERTPDTDDPSADPLVGYDLRRLRPSDEHTLADTFERLRADALAEGKRVVVLFSADWCEPCKHLDLELGNRHPTSMIGDVRIVELKEDDWKAAARMDEFNQLRSRWEPTLGTYPLIVLLDREGKRVDEMKEAKERLERAGLEPTLPVWFAETRSDAPVAAP